MSFVIFVVPLNHNLSGHNSGEISLVSTDLANQAQIAGMIWAGGTRVQGLLNSKLSAAHTIILTIKKGIHLMTKLTEYLPTAAAAEHLGVAQNTLRKWAARGDIPMHRNPVNG